MIITVAYSVSRGSAAVEAPPLSMSDTISAVSMTGDGQRQHQRAQRLAHAMGHHFGMVHRPRSRRR